MAHEVGALGHAALLSAEARRHLALGITACHDPCVPPSLQPLLERVRKETPLRLSWSSVAEDGLLEPADEFCPTCGDGPPSAKLFMDGAHKCALCLDPRHVLKMMGATAIATARGNFAPLRELFAYRSVYRAGRFYTPYLRMDAGGADPTARDARDEQYPPAHPCGRQSCGGVRLSGTRRRRRAQRYARASDLPRRARGRCGRGNRRGRVAAAGLHRALRPRHPGSPTWFRTCAPIRPPACCAPAFLWRCHRTIRAGRSIRCATSAWRSSAGLPTAA